MKHESALSSRQASSSLCHPLDISVCIATFRRPQKLSRLLDSLQRLAGLDGCAIEIVIVDNDAEETARAVVEAVCDNYPHPLRYYVEPRPHFAYARHRTIQEARGTWIAIIDDDEVAAENWLAAYWQAHIQHPGDGYFGPVLSRFEQTAPVWLNRDILSFFFRTPRYATGMRMPAQWLRDGNVFLRRSLFQTHTYDPNFSFAGCDLELLSRMSDAGATFYACDEAVTYEYYPPERMRLRWLLQRAFKGGYTYTRIDKARCPYFFPQALSLAKAIVGMCLFTLMLPFEMFRGLPYVIRRLLQIIVQVGHLWQFCRLGVPKFLT